MIADIWNISYNSQYDTVLQLRIGLKSEQWVNTVVRGLGAVLFRRIGWIRIIFKQEGKAQMTQRWKLNLDRVSVPKHGS